MRSIRAHFQQRLIDDSGAVLQQSDGTLLLSHPARFRWETSEPYQQLVVSDGTTVWQYDPDLMQVVVRPLDQRADQLPSLLLGGDIDAVQGRFAIQGEEPVDNASAFVLKPLDDDALFQQLAIRFEDGVLRSMRISDGFGQVTELGFTAVEQVQAFTPDRFGFTPPPDVDVLYDE